jgi:hypothetical protein
MRMASHQVESFGRGKWNDFLKEPNTYPGIENWNDSNW